LPKEIFEHPGSGVEIVARAKERLREAGLVPAHDHDLTQAHRQFIASTERSALGVVVEAVCLRRCTEVLAVSPVEYLPIPPPASATWSPVSWSQLRTQEPVTGFVTAAASVWNPVIREMVANNVFGPLVRARYAASCRERAGDPTLAPDAASALATVITENVVAAITPLLVLRPRIAVDDQLLTNVFIYVASHTKGARTKLLAQYGLEHQREDGAVLILSTEPSEETRAELRLPRGYRWRGSEFAELLERKASRMSAAIVSTTPRRRYCPASIVIAPDGGAIIKDLARFTLLWEKRAGFPFGNPVIGAPVLGSFGLARQPPSPPAPAN
jgi:hypothetical protein